MRTVLAFYKVPRTFFDRIIRLVTRSQYSHVEIIEDLDSYKIFCGEKQHKCWSSSPRDGGVRAKYIHLDGDHWDIVEVPWHRGKVEHFFFDYRHAHYDWFGILFCQFFNLQRQDPLSWFCSEICGAALGLTRPERNSPAGLKFEVEMLNAVYAAGLEGGNNGR